MSFDKVRLLEIKIAEFYGAPYAVATDSCTHAIELCLRYTKSTFAESPLHTYASIPMIFMKLNIDWKFKDEQWIDYYYVTDNIVDAAVYWKENSYIKNTFMCLSFQFKKHLGLGRGGMILCHDKDSAKVLKKMSYDGRLPNMPWAEQNIDTLGYHYYMTPETAELGLQKFPEVANNTPRAWTYLDYPDLSKMKVFNYGKS